MQFSFLSILLLAAIALAPDDHDKIELESSGNKLVLERVEEGWDMAGEDGGAGLRVTLESGTLRAEGREGEKQFKVDVGEKAGELEANDWEQNAVFELEQGVLIEREEGGYRVRIAGDEGQEFMVRIRHLRKDGVSVAGGEEVEP